MSKNSKVSDELLVTLIANGMTVPQIATTYKVNPSGLYRKLDKISERANLPKSNYLSEPQKSHPGPRTPSVTIQTVNDSCDAKMVKELYAKLRESMQEFLTTRKGD